MNKRIRFHWWGVVLIVVLISCLLANIIAPYKEAYLDLGALSNPPSIKHFFGTTPLGGDVFSLLLYGGRTSLYIGILATFVSSGLGIIVGGVSGYLGGKAKGLLMKMTELFLAIPSFLLTLCFLGIAGEVSRTWLALAIGLSSWMPVAKLVGEEVGQIKNREFVLAAKLTGAKFPYILRKHFLPNFFPAIMYMVVTRVGQAILVEATLSFLGIGLPLSMASWGSLMALSSEEILTSHWWTIFIPGGILVITLVSITQMGEYLKKNTGVVKYL